MATTYPIRERIICSKCLNVFYPDINIKEAKRECPFCKHIIDVTDKTLYYKKWRENNPECAKRSLYRLRKYYDEDRKERLKEKRKRVKSVVLNILSNGNPHCVRCGCDDIRLLEVNHKNGGGHQESKDKTRLLFTEIFTGRRKTDDLELLCRVCNAWHYLELKYGKLPYNIIYHKENKEEVNING